MIEIELVVSSAGVPGSLGISVRLKTRDDPAIVTVPYVVMMLMDDDPLGAVVRVDRVVVKVPVSLMTMAPLNTSSFPADVVCVNGTGLPLTVCNDHVPMRLTVTGPVDEFSAQATRETSARTAKRAAMLADVKRINMRVR